jgi:hypothetical protein
VKKLLLAAFLMLFVSCAPRAGLGLVTAVKVTFLGFTAIKDCDEGLAGQGEFAFSFQVGDQVLDSRSSSNPVGLSDEETYTSNRIGIVDLITSSVIINASVSEIDPVSSITPISYSKRFITSENYGINLPGTIWKVRGTPSSTCDVELSYMIEKI